eukprot:9472249-Pyramimonas_sp.AAC.1
MGGTLTMSGALRPGLHGWGPTCGTSQPDPAGGASWVEPGGRHQFDSCSTLARLKSTDVRRSIDALAERVAPG